MYYFYRRAKYFLNIKQFDNAIEANQQAILVIPFMPVAGIIDGSLIGYLLVYLFIK